MIKSRRMGWAEHVARMRAKMNAHMILVGKPEGKRALGRPRCRWVDNIVTDFTILQIDGTTQRPGTDFGVPMQRFSFRIHETQKYKSIATQYTSRTDTSMATGLLTVVFLSNEIVATEYTSMREVNQ
jgi:hypothetical protein